MTLDEYLTRCRDRLHDDNGNFYSTTKLTRWINQGRQEVAKRSRCVRVLGPTTASLASVTVNSGGAAYASATAVVSAPDATDGTYTRATVSVTLSGGGAVTGLVVTNPGSGYVANPTITITSATGSGAIVTAVLGAHVATVTAQERYLFSAMSTTLRALYAGLGNIIDVQSVAVSWGAMKPALDYVAFGDMQAHMRAYPNYQDRPRVWSRFNIGDQGSLYLWPKPGGVYQMEVDCYCTVLDLSASQTTDLIPDPWNDAVVEHAVYLAYRNAQRFDDARLAMSARDELMNTALGVAIAPITPSYYGS